jgi:hypothetical protein
MTEPLYLSRQRHPARSMPARTFTRSGGRILPAHRVAGLRGDSVMEATCKHVASRAAVGAYGLVSPELEGTAARPASSADRPPCGDLLSARAVPAHGRWTVDAAACGRPRHGGETAMRRRRQPTRRGQYGRARTTRQDRQGLLIERVISRLETHRGFAYGPTSWPSVCSRLPWTSSSKRG